MAPIDEPGVGQVGQGAPHGDAGDAVLPPELLFGGQRRPCGDCAAATRGLDEAIDRANAALDAGADVAFVEAITSLDDAEAVPKRVHGPCLLNIVPGGRTPVMDLSLAEDMGYKIAICPGLLLGAYVAIGDMMLKELADTRVHPSRGRGSPGGLFARLGAAEWDAIRETATS